jgi:hypothetical protein
MLLRLLVVLAVLSAGGRAWADEAKGFDLGFVRPGMSLTDFRRAFDNKDIRVVCGGEDMALAPSLAAALTLEDGMVAAGLNRCRHLQKSKAKGKNPAWTSVLVKLGGTCCVDLFVTTVVIDGEPRVAQINAKAGEQAFMELMVDFAVEYGPPDSFDETKAIWRRPTHTAALLANDGATFLVIFDHALKAEWDKRLGRGG